MNQNLVLDDAKIYNNIFKDTSIIKLIKKIV